MPRYGEYGGNAFLAGPADVYGHISSSTAEGHFFLLAWIEFDFGGAAVFLFKICVTSGILSVTRQGPAQSISSSAGPSILKTLQKQMGSVGVRFRPIDACMTLSVVVDNIHTPPNSEPTALQLETWFPAVRAFLTSMHAVMVKLKNERYVQGQIRGLFGEAITGRASAGETPLNSRDLHGLVVQCPYLHMTGAGRLQALPDRGRLSHIARHMAWWRMQSGEDSEVAKGKKNQLLSNALLSKHGAKVHEDFHSALVRCYEHKLDDTYRDFLASARKAYLVMPPPFLPAHMSDVILPQTLVEDCPIPASLYSLISPARDKDKSTVDALAATAARGGQVEHFPWPDASSRSSPFTPSPLRELSSAGSSEHPVSPASTSASVRMPVSSPRRLPWKRAKPPPPAASRPSRDDLFTCHPWLVPRPDPLRPATACPPTLGPAFPQAGRVLMPAAQLQSLNVFTGYAWPEFQGTKRGASRSADDDAAGICERGTSHRVVSAAPGALCQPYKRLLQGEKLYQPDNDKAEGFHRLSLATTQQTYLRNVATRDNFFPARVGSLIPHACKGRSTCLTAPGTG